MSEAVLVAVISSGITLIGVIIANSRTQAVMEVKIEELTREVRIHNDFARRVPVIEERVESLRRRVGDLEDDSK